MQSILWTEKGCPNRYTEFGCSPKLLKNIINLVEENINTLASLDVAMYLFNNPVLLQSLLRLARNGCIVTVYSIPLEGYDNRNSTILYEYGSNKLLGSFTKFDVAKEIYTSLKNSKPANFHFRIVPQMYLRSSTVNPFSRGNMPYCLHCKTFFAQKHNGDQYVGITSSNMAVRDAEKFEICSIFPVNNTEAASSLDFFAGLYDNSISIEEFDEEFDSSHWQTVMRPQPSNCSLMYTAPFYNNSPIQFENNIKSFISDSSRIAICAQHISAYQYSINGRFLGEDTDTMIQKPGFLDDVLKKAQNGSHIYLLSQTYSDKNGSHGCRVPQNTTSFVKFAEKAKQSGCHYCVNPYIHAKYIVADDAALITTSNFTPTQFIYLPSVNISQFKKMPTRSFRGVFCEYGVYYVTSNTSVVRSLKDYTNSIWTDQNSRHIY